MNGTANSNSSVTLVRPEQLKPQFILEELLPCKKGPEHIIFVAGSTSLNSTQAFNARKFIKERIKRMGIPYKLHFYLCKYGKAGLICYWYPDPELYEYKEIFDRNADLGIYPKVRKHTWRNKNEEGT